MTDTITLRLVADGFTDVTVDLAEYETAKAAGELDQMLDVYTSDIDPEVAVYEPDGTIVQLPEGNVLAPPPPETRHDRTDGPIHGHFGLTYAQYQVLNRTLMQSMPVEWQERMVACLDEMRDAFDHVDKPESYIVKPAREATYSDLTEVQMQLLGVTVDLDVDPTPNYYDEDGNEHQGYDRVYIPTGIDPIPHYRRGWVEPAGAAALS